MMPPPPYSATAQSYSIIPVAPISAHQSPDSNAGMRLPPTMFHNVAAAPQAGYSVPMGPQAVRISSFI